MKQLDMFKPAYEYKGYLKPWLPAFDRLREQGMSKRDAARKLLADDEELRAIMREHRTCTDAATLVASLFHAVEARRGDVPLLKGISGYPMWDRTYARARREHVFLLRAEGLKWREVGARIGTGGTRAMQLSYLFARSMKRAMRHTKVEVT